MLPAIVNMPLPDLVAIALVCCVPLLLVALSWRFVAPRSVRKQRLSSHGASVLQSSGRLLGLAGQWQVQERRIGFGIERQSAAIQLHRQVALQIGALDYEIDQLWRETRALGTAAAVTLGNVSPLFPATRRPQPIAQAYAAFRLAAGAVHPQAMAS